MAGNVDHIVHAPRDPVVAIGIATRAVAGEVASGVGLEIGVDEPLVIAVHGAHLTRPAVEQHQIALTGTREGAPLGVDDGRLYAEERQRGRARLQIGGAG